MEKFNIGRLRASIVGVVRERTDHFIITVTFPHYVQCGKYLSAFVFYILVPV